MEEPKPNDSESHANSGKVDSPSLAETKKQVKVADPKKATGDAEEKITRSTLQSWRIWESVKSGWAIIKSPESTNLIMAAATVVIAIFTGLTFWLVLGSSQDTQRMIAATETQAQAAGDQADAAQQFSDTAEDINDRMSEAVDQLTAAADNAKAGIRATQGAMRLDQRAWVGMGHMEVEPAQAIAPNTEITFTAFISNSGKTPAFAVKSLIHWKGLRPGDPLIGPPLSAPQGQVVLFPGNPLSIKTDTIKFTPEEIEILKTGTMAFKVWGEITYEDINRRPHWTHFCAFLARDLRNLSACDSYNETDDKRN